MWRPAPSSVLGDKQSRESESKQVHRPIADNPRQLSITTAIAVQKTKSRNLESNLGPLWQLPKVSEKRREITSYV